MSEVTLMNPDEPDDFVPPGHRSKSVDWEGFLPGEIVYLGTKPSCESESTSGRLDRPRPLRDYIYGKDGETFVGVDANTGKVIHSPPQRDWELAVEQQKREAQAAIANVLAGRVVVLPAGLDVRTVLPAAIGITVEQQKREAEPVKQFSFGVQTSTSSARLAARRAEPTQRERVLARCAATDERTTIGLLAEFFDCEACCKRQPREKLAGGVWVDGQHLLVCTDHG